MLFLSEGFSQVIRVTNNRVGIGTNSPAHKLHVAGDVYGNWIRTAGSRGLYSQSYGTYLQALNTGYWAVRSDRGLVIRNRVGTNRGYLYHNNSNSFGLLDGDGNWSVRIERDAYTRWAINNVIRMTLQNNGRLDLPNGADANGTANTGALQIQGALRIDGNEVITNSGTSLLLQHDNNGDLRVDNTTLFVDASANRIYTPYIGDANNSNYYVDPNSISRFNLVLPASDNVGYCGTTASTWNYGYFKSLYRQYEYTLSDRRAKENIRGIDNAIGKIMQLEGKLFNYKNSVSENEEFMNNSEIGIKTNDQILPIHTEDKTDDSNITASIDDEGIAPDEVIQKTTVSKELLSTVEPEKLSAKDLKELKITDSNAKAASKDTYGFIAQEVEEIIPEAVTYDKENDIYSMSYSSVIPILVEGMKEQQMQIAAQQKQIEDLKKIINQKLD